MKKGKVRIIIGFILVLLQLLSVLGNAKSGAKISLSFDNPNIFLYDLIGLFSYFLVGIIGVVLLVSGLIAYNRRPKEIRDIKKPTINFWSCLQKHLQMLQKTVEKRHRFF